MLIYYVKVKQILSAHTDNVLGKKDTNKCHVNILYVVYKDKLESITKRGEPWTLES